MNNKNLFLGFLFGLIILLGIGTISAADINSTGTQSAEDTVASIETKSVEKVTDIKKPDNHVQETNNEVKQENKKIKNKNTQATVKTTQQKTGVKSIKKEDAGTFNDLQKEIDDTKDTLELKRNYVQASTDNNITINKDITINGHGYTLDANGYKKNIFTINNAHITLQNMILKNSTDTSISINNTKLTLNNVTATDNNIERGAIVYATNSSDIIVSDGTYANNNASNGIFCNVAGNTLVYNGVFENNNAKIAGVIYNYMGNATVYNGTFTNNNATVGGVIFNQGNTTIYDGIFNNSTAQLAGVIYNNDTLTVNGGTYTNSNVSIAGVIFNNDTLVLSGGVYTNNNAQLAGVIYNNGTLTAFGGLYDNNFAVGGAAVIANDNASIIIENAVYTNNNVSGYGAVIYNLDGNVSFINVTCRNNSASRGGVVYNYGSLSVINGSYTDNRASYVGGVIDSYGGNVFINNTHFSENYGVRGAVVVNRENLTIIDGTYTNNHALTAAVIFNQGDVILEGGNYTNNVADSESGVLDNDYGNALIIGGIYSNNTAQWGGVFSNGDNLTIRNAVINENNGKYTVNSYDETNLIMDNTTFTNNNCSGFLFNTNKTAVMTITDNTYIGNNLTTIMNITPDAITSNDMINITITLKTYEAYNTTINKGKIMVYENNNLVCEINVTDETTKMEYAPKGGKYNLTFKYIDDNNSFTKVNQTITMDLPKTDVTVTVDAIKGFIGENITLTAHITDIHGNNVTGGNIVFKLNGISIRENNTLDSKSQKEELKLAVKNGLVTYTLNDTYTLENVQLLKNIINITASYSGSYHHNNAKSDEAPVEISLRTAEITVTTPALAKQNSNITITAVIKDTTQNSTVNYLQSNKIIFKINGITIKDDDGNIIMVDINNNTAAIDYTIPRATVAANKTADPKNYTVTAIYANKIVKMENNTIKLKNEIYSYTVNKAVFNVEKSPVNINVTYINIEDNKLNITANLTDYQGNNIIGTGKIVIKVNGITVNGTDNKTLFFNITDGILDLNDIILPTDNIHNITIVSGERYAYKKAQVTFYS